MGEHMRSTVAENARGDLGERRCTVLTRTSTAVLSTVYPVRYVYRDLGTPDSVTDRTRAPFDGSKPARERCTLHWEVILIDSEAPR